MAEVDMEKFYKDNWEASLAREEAAKAELVKEKIRAEQAEARVEFLEDMQDLAKGIR